MVLSGGVRVRRPWTRWWWWGLVSGRQIKGNREYTHNAYVLLNTALRPDTSIDLFIFEASIKLLNLMISDTGIDRN